VTWRRLPIKRLGDVFLGKMIQPQPKSESDVAAPYLRAAHVQPNGQIIDVDDKTMWFNEEELKLHDLHADDVVIVEGGAGYGRSAVLRADRDGWGFQNSIVRVRPRDSAATGRFLDYALQAARSAGVIEVACFTATIPHFTADKVGAFQVSAPPVEEQRAIADYLDRETARIDTLIEEQQRLIEMLRERRTAVITHATSQGMDIEFRRVITALRQGWSPNCESWPADGVEEWGVLKVGCANTGRFDPAENKRLPDEETPRPEFTVRRGELVMSRSNTKDLVGAAAVVDGDYPRLLLSDLTYGISLTADADPAFVAYALASAGMRVQISAASKGMSHSMQKISQRDIRELRLQLPALDEQRRIAAYLNEQTAKIDALVEETGRFIEFARERRAALITAAVTGQIDVREMAA
jgi:type I restriction enzyme S subunit